MIISNHAPGHAIYLAGFGWDHATGIAALVAATGAVWAVRLYFLTGARIKVHAEFDTNRRLRITVGNLGRLRTDVKQVGISTLCRRRPTRKWPYFRRRHELLNLRPQIKIEDFNAGPLEPGDSITMYVTWPEEVREGVRGTREAIRNGRPSNWYYFTVKGIEDRRIRVAVVYYDGIKAVRIRPNRHSRVTFPKPVTAPRELPAPPQSSGWQKAIPKFNRKGRS